MSPDRSRPVTREDLLSAWLDARRYAQAHEDLRRFHERRLRAMESAFLVDLAKGPDQAPAGPPQWLVESVPDGMRSALRGGRSLYELQRLFLRSTEHFLEAGSVFGGYLEAPPVVVGLHRRHGGTLRAAAEASRRGYRSLLLDLLELLWGMDSETRVDRARVVAAGFDPDERAPEPEDYW